MRIINQQFSLKTLIKQSNIFPNKKATQFKKIIQAHHVAEDDVGYDVPVLDAGAAGVMRLSGAEWWGAHWGLRWGYIGQSETWHYHALAFKERHYAFK